MANYKQILSIGIFMQFMMMNFLYAQDFDQVYVFKGPVKTLSLEMPNYGDHENTLNTIVEYDRSGRKIKETSPYKSVSEFLYKTTSDKKPLLTKQYSSIDNKITGIEIEDRNSNGKTLLSGTLASDSWSYYYIHDYASNLQKIRWFTDGEIYLEKTEETINLNTFKIPEGFVPFKWDRKTSFGVIKKSKEFADDRYEHDVTFEFVEKNKPENKVIFRYKGADVYDAGKGYWNRYEDGKEIEERYIYDATDISDFGHRYEYDEEGKLVSDYYGYFNQMPTTFMQRNRYIYNENGDCIQKISDAEDAKTNSINYKYTYDKNKNWISKTSTYEDGSGGTIRRNFTYYNPDELDLKNSLSESIYAAYLKELKAYKPIAEKQFQDYILARDKKQDSPLDQTDYQTLRSKNWKDFLPKGQVLDSLTTGDLNKDGLDDLVMVYESEKLLKQEKNDCRTLIILLKQKDGYYQLAAESNGAISGENMNNVFFNGLEIKNGILIIQHDFLRGGCVHKYRYQNGGFYLIGAEQAQGDAEHSSSVDYNLSTGKYIYTYHDYSEDGDSDESNEKEGYKTLSALPNIETYEIISLELEGFYL
ncbi:hypothetical protein [Sphingobacterium hungaricum]|nr:hypothetical protein [Sphingobacterium hungaricum]